MSEAAASSCGKRVPWVDGRFLVTNDALKQNKKTQRRRSNPKSGSVAAGCAVQWLAGDIDERGLPCSVSGAVVGQLGEMGAHVWEANGGVVAAVGGALRHARRVLSRAAAFQTT